MKTNRRKFLQASAIGLTGAQAAHQANAAGPFDPPEGGLTADWFDKGKQHFVPTWAFTNELFSPPTPRPKSEETWKMLASDAKSDPFGDGLEVGKVLHGIAAEWNGDLIGGNGGKDSAWEAMRERLRPDVAADDFDSQELGNWAKFGDQAEGGLVRCYHIELKEALHKLREDAAHPALLYTYEGMTPGPTFKFRHGMPCVVRFSNRLQTEASIHHHGGHTPSHSDGFPNFYVLQGEKRDYLYPNILPIRLNESGKTELDIAEGQSTTWYHDHALDATAYNVAKGLAGFLLWYDDLELGLIEKGVLPGLRGISNSEITISPSEFTTWFESWKALAQAPTESANVAEWRQLLAKAEIDPNDPLPDSDEEKRKLAWKIDASAKAEGTDLYHTGADGGPGVGTPYFNPYELPIVLQDRVIDQNTGQIVYDNDGHNGYIGNTQLVNGVAWPVKQVKSRKYRFRILDGSNARIYRLRFLDEDTLNLRPNDEGFLEPAEIDAQTMEERSVEFLRIGKDSWLWPTPQKRKSALINMANRADLVVDFKACFDAAERAGRLRTIEGKRYAVYYLVNTMPQFDGRGPKGKLAEDAGDPTVFPLPFNLNRANPVVGAMADAGVIPGTFFGNTPLGQASELEQPIALMKFLIEEDKGEGPDATIDESSILRPRHSIKDEEVEAVREFVFERGKGAWMVNGHFYDPTVANATPVNGIKGLDFQMPGQADRKPSLGYAEEWILRNGGGGWWHPIHIHLEGHQLIGYEKDFEADALIDGDGLLGAQGQPAMAALPGWEDLVGKFGLDTLKAGGDTRVIERVLTKPKIEDLREEFVEQAPALPVIFQSPHPGISLFKELRIGPTITKAIADAPTNLRPRINAILNALDELRLQWAGEMIGNHDTQALGPNTVARIRMRFRSFTGPVVFHCHNVEHEDMRMMFNLEPMMATNADGTATNPNTHDPNISPAARTHGQDVTDLKTNPNAVGELPWETHDGLPHWAQKPIPGTSVEETGDPLIKPRNNHKPKPKP